MNRLFLDLRCFVIVLSKCIVLVCIFSVFSCLRSFVYHCCVALLCIGVSVVCHCWFRQKVPSTWSGSADSGAEQAAPLALLSTCSSSVMTGSGPSYMLVLTARSLSWYSIGRPFCCAPIMITCGDAHGGNPDKAKGRGNKETKV